MYVNPDLVKNFLSESDKSFLKKYSKKTNEIKPGIFYIDKQWSTKNNNYLYDKLKERYYIIEKDYYYFIKNLDRFIINCKDQVYLLDISLYPKNIAYL
jgi:hypothetical protein